MAQSTHDVTFEGSRVVKRYRSGNEGEPEREWSGLSLLHRFSPGLAPEPLEQRRDDGRPVLVMRRLAGQPLGTAALSLEQVTALGQTLRRLFGAVPPDEMRGLAQRRWGPAELVPTVRSWIREPHEQASASVEAALRAATAWLAGPAVTSLAGPLAECVFTQADGNIGNFLWDGERCYVVDFEDSGTSDPAYEVADLLEHVSVWLPGIIDARLLVAVLGFTPEHEARLGDFRRLMAVFWLLMLQPGNPGHDRNPSGSVDRQARRVLDLLLAEVEERLSGPRALASAEPTPHAEQCRAAPVAARNMRGRGRWNTPDCRRRTSRPCRRSCRSSTRRCPRTRSRCSRRSCPMPPRADVSRQPGRTAMSARSSSSGAELAGSRSP